MHTARQTGKWRISSLNPGQTNKHVANEFWYSTVLCCHYYMKCMQHIRRIRELHTTKCGAHTYATTWKVNEQHSGSSAKAQKCEWHVVAAENYLYTRERCLNPLQLVCCREPGRSCCRSGFFFNYRCCCRRICIVCCACVASSPLCLMHSPMFVFLPSPPSLYRCLYVQMRAKLNRRDVCVTTIRLPIIMYTCWHNKLSGSQFNYAAQNYSGDLLL